MVIEEFEHAGLTVRIGHEDEQSVFDPRDNDNLGIMVCWHRRSTLGDVQIDEYGDRFKSLRHIERYLCIMRGAKVVLPLFLYEHSGMTMRTRPFGDPWDSGQVGFIYTTQEQIDKLGVPDEPDEWKRQLQNEVEEYDAWLRGEVYYYSILDADGDPLDGCGGYVGDLDYVRTEARQAAEVEADALAARARDESQEAAWAASMDIATTT